MPENIRTLRVLLVDDDVTSRTMLRAALERAGFAIEEAENGQQGAQMFERMRPDILLMDVMMPVMDGFTACALIRQQHWGAHVPILMMTGLDDVESINRAYQVGATDFITKPINHILLLHRVRYILRAKQMQDRLRASEARLANAQRIAKIGHWECEAESKQAYWSRGVLRILGLNQTNGKLSTYNDFLEYVHPEDRSALDLTFKRALASRKGYNIEHRVMRQDGVIRHVHQEAECIISEDERVWLVGTLQDITERRQAEQQIHTLAHYSKVTGLPNRSLFKRILEESLIISKRQGTSVAILALDLDHFNRIVDSFGYEAGDELLQEIGCRLKERMLQRNALLSGFSTRELRTINLLDTHTRSNFVAHLGGDEFVVMLNEMQSAEDAATLARDLITIITQPYFFGNGQEVCLTASIGITVFPDDGVDAESLLKQAGAALNHAKGEGRNCYKFYKSSMNARAFARLSIEVNLRKALAQGQFCLHYQPKVELRNNEVVGIEALVRWEHPDLGLVSSGEFVPVAEETGLIIPLSEWILSEACRQVIAWQAQGLPALRVAVNLSAAQFNQPNLAALMADILKKSGIDPQLLEIEITESVLMQQGEATLRTLHELRQLGLSISIDDFGTGYSSLAYLKRFPVSALKIDQSFVRDVTDDPGDAAIVRAIVRLAHDLGLKAIAEGVEQESQLHFLRGLGCDEVQGYYFSRPLRADVLPGWLRARILGPNRLQAVS